MADFGQYFSSTEIPSVTEESTSDTVQVFNNVNDFVQQESQNAPAVHTQRDLSSEFSKLLQQVQSIAKEESMISSEDFGENNVIQLQHAHSFQDLMMKVAQQPEVQQPIKEFVADLDAKLKSNMKFLTRLNNVRPQFFDRPLEDLSSMPDPFLRSLGSVPVEELLIYHEWLYTFERQLQLNMKRMESGWYLNPRSPEEMEYTSEDEYVTESKDLQRLFGEEVSPHDVFNKRLFLSEWDYRQMVLNTRLNEMQTQLRTVERLRGMFVNAWDRHYQSAMGQPWDWKGYALSKGRSPRGYFEQKEWDDYVKFFNMPNIKDMAVSVSNAIAMKLLFQQTIEGLYGGQQALQRSRTARTVPKSGYKIILKKSSRGGRR